MSKIQPGVGYNVTNSSSGISLDIEQQGWTPPGDQVILAAQFDPVFNFAPEYVNHYKVNVPEQQVEGSFVLKIAKGGNVWMPQGSTCALEKRADVITTDGTTLVVVPGADADSPWASDDGYIVLTSGGEVAYYVYAYKVETADSSDFYIYASTDDTLADSCPAILPDGITPPSEPYDVQVVMVASVAWSVESLAFVVNQHVVGSITWPGITGGGSTEYVNQFEMAVKNVDIEGTLTPVLKVASGGHIYRPVSSTCDKTDFTDVITPDPSGPSPVVVVTGTGTSVPWASDDGYVEISAGSFYAYALKVETEAEAEFYIYVSKDGTLDSSCPVPIPAGITEPTDPYTVQCLKIGSANYADGVWTIDQKLIGSITWPSSGGSVAADPEQFKVEVSGNNVKVAKGRIVAMHSSDFPLMYTLDQKMLEFNVEGFAVYPDGSRVEGGNPNSVWCSQNGYVTITNAEDKNDWGVYIIRNQLGPYGDLGTYPLLAVMADDSDAYDKSKAFPPGTGSSGQYHWGAYQEIINVTISGPDGGSGKLIGSVMPYALQNFCCERLKIASITWDADTSKWVVTQHLIGSLTIPSNIVGGVVTEVTTLPPYPTSSLPGFKTECQAWFDAWTGYTKLLTPSSGYTTSIIES